MPEQFANTAKSTLASGFTIGGSTLTLASSGGAAFPATGPFAIKIDNEYFIVGTRSGDVLSSLTPAAEGSTAANHSLGATVTHILTARSLLAGIVDPTQSTLNGTTSGSAISSMPTQAPTYKRFIVYFNAYFNSTGTPQTITFPTAFATVNVITLNVDPACTVSLTTLTLPASMGAAVTGIVIVEGY